MTAKKKYSKKQIVEFARSVEYYLAPCAIEQPYDHGLQWVIPHSTLKDVMERAGVPEECQELVAGEVECPSGDGPHGLWDEVGLKSQGELRYEGMLTDWYGEHAKRLEDFSEYIQRFPSLGAVHELGVEIRGSIDKFPVTSVDDRLLYRARGINDGRDLSSEEFLAPDPTKIRVGEGRFNHQGQSALYLAGDPDGAVLEAVKEGEMRAWVQAFRVRGVKRVLDLSADEEWTEEGLPLLVFGLLHAGPLREFADRSHGWKPEYLIPRYIADCAKEKGFEGIRFKSVRHIGDNYVLFDSAVRVAMPEGEPEIRKAAAWKAEWRYLPSEKWPKFITDPIEPHIPDDFEDPVSI